MEELDQHDTSNEPSVGEKRPREDDEVEPSERQETPPESKIGSSDFSNAGSQMQNNIHQGTVSTPVNIPALPSSMDALYIGELQWVCFSCYYCTSCILKLYIFILKVDFGRGYSKTRSKSRCQYRTEGCHLL